MHRQNRGSRHGCAPETAGSGEVLMVIRVVETSVRDGLPGTWRVNKTTGT